MLSPEEADRHDLSEALAQLDEHQPGDAPSGPAGVDHAALRAALGGEGSATAGGVTRATPDDESSVDDDGPASRETVSQPTSPPLLTPVPDPPRRVTPPLELDWPTGGDQQLVIEDEPPRRSLLSRRPLDADEGMDPELIAQQRIRRRNWTLVALAILVAAAVLAFVAMRASQTDSAPEVVAASQEPSATSGAPAAVGPPADPRQLTPNVTELLTLLGLTPEQIAAVDSGPLIDAGEGDALAGQPRIEQAGAFLLTLDAEASSSLFGSSGTAPCGTHNDLHGGPFHSACTTAVRDPRPDSYLMVWVDSGQSYLAPESAAASIRVSVDTNADGAVDIPANVVSKGADGVELDDGATGLGTQALVLGSAMAFLIPVDAETVPQWALATAATTGQLSDIIDWQRWLIEPEGGRRAASAVYGADVRP